MLPRERKGAKQGMKGGRSRKDRIVAHRNRRARQSFLLGTGGALAIALGSVWSVASFNGVDLAGAAVAKAQSIADVMSGRSPGERTQGQLTKIKHKRHFRVLADRGQPEAPIALLPPPFAEALAPPPPVLLPEVAPVLAQAAPPLPLFAKPAPGGAVFFSPGGGGGGPGGGGGGVVTPPAQPPAPPSQPPETPAVPEPGTWAMMLLGFAFTGLALRRARQAAPRSFLNRDTCPLPHIGRPRTGA